MVLGDAGSGNLNSGRRRGGKVDRRSVSEENKEEEEKGIGGDEEERGRGGENERRGGGVVLLAMQVLEIPAGGRGFPLVILKLAATHITTLRIINEQIYN